MGQVAYNAVALVQGFYFFKTYNAFPEEESFQTKTDHSFGLLYYKYEYYGYLARINGSVYSIWFLSRCLVGGYGDIPEEIEVLQEAQKRQVVYICAVVYNI